MADKQIADNTMIDEDEINLLLTLPPIYASTASIFPPQQEGSMSGIASQLSGGLGALAISILCCLSL